MFAWLSTTNIEHLKLAHLWFWRETNESTNNTPLSSEQPKREWLKNFGK
jgi:hypothetical protein